MAQDYLVPCGYGFRSGARARSGAAYPEAFERFS